MPPGQKSTGKQRQSHNGSIASDPLSHVDIQTQLTDSNESCINKYNASDPEMKTMV